MFWTRVVSLRRTLADRKLALEHPLLSEEDRRFARYLQAMFRVTESKRLARLHRAFDSEFPLGWENSERLHRISDVMLNRSV